MDAAAAVLAARAMKPADTFVQYTADAALAANQKVWTTAYVKGEIGRGDPDAKKVLDGIIAGAKIGAQAVPYLQILLGKDPQAEEERNKAMQALSDMQGGNAENGKLVFRRNCIACHRVLNEGEEYGPQMDAKGKDPGVGKRLSKFKIVESIIDPNEDVDPKYVSTQIVDANGKTTVGLVVSRTKDDVVIFDGKEKVTIKVEDIELEKQSKQSSMPEGLAGTISPQEFLDVVAFLASLK